MAVAQLGPGTRSYIGLHADVKPASDTGALFYETDTGDWFIYDGAAWQAYEYPLVGAGDPASGDLAGTYPNPTVAALHTGATKLTVGAVADGEYLKRDGSTLVGDTPAGGGGDADFSAVGEDVLPADDDTYDLGSQAKRWAEGWFSDDLHLANDKALVWRNPAGDADVAWLKGIPAVDDGDPPYPVLRIGGGDSFRFIVDTENYGYMFGMGNQGFLVTNETVFDPTVIFDKDYSLQDINGFRVFDESDAGHVIQLTRTVGLVLSNGRGLNVDGALIANLPNSNPGAGSGLWVDESDGFTVKQGHA